MVDAESRNPADIIVWTDWFQVERLRLYLSEVIRRRAAQNAHFDESKDSGFGCDDGADERGEDLCAGFSHNEESDGKKRGASLRERNNKAAAGQSSTDFAC